MIITLILHCVGFMEQGWRSGDSTFLSLLWPAFNSRTWRHMWVDEFVVGSHPCSEGVFPGLSDFPAPTKTNTPNVIWPPNLWTKNYSVDVPLLIPIYLFIYYLIVHTRKFSAAPLTLCVCQFPPLPSLLKYRNICQHFILKKSQYNKL